jgi:hypothetical protein
MLLTKKVKAAIIDSMRKIIYTLEIPSTVTNGFVTVTYKEGSLARSRWYHRITHVIWEKKITFDDEFVLWLSQQSFINKHMDEYIPVDIRDTNSNTTETFMIRSVSCP